MISIQRIYSSPRTAQGNEFRVLIDRLWPRGIKRETAGVDLWLKEIAPSNELRAWFKHDPEKWADFKKKYFEELKDKNGLVETLLSQSRGKNIVLLYGAKDEIHNNAVALKAYIESYLKMR